jgi:hypothetical protein
MRARHSRGWHAVVYKCQTCTLCRSIVLHVRPVHSASFVQLSEWLTLLCAHSLHGAEQTLSMDELCQVIDDTANADAPCTSIAAYTHAHTTACAGTCPSITGTTSSPQSLAGVQSQPDYTLFRRASFAYMRRRRPMSVDLGYGGSSSMSDYGGYGPSTLMFSAQAASGSGTVTRAMRGYVPRQANSCVTGVWALECHTHNTAGVSSSRAASSTSSIVHSTVGLPDATIPSSQLIAPHTTQLWCAHHARTHTRLG